MPKVNSERSQRGEREIERETERVQLKDLCFLGSMARVARCLWIHTFLENFID